VVYYDDSWVLWCLIVLFTEMHGIRLDLFSILFTSSTTPDVLYCVGQEHLLDDTRLIVHAI
jgi:hypothetical protein